MAKILVLMVPHDDATIRPHYGIEHEGVLWLVTAWLVDRRRGVAMPELMIRLSRASVTAGGPGSKWDYTVSTPLPKDVLEGHVPGGIAYETRSPPNVPLANAADVKPLPTFP